MIKNYKVKGYPAYKGKKSIPNDDARCHTRIATHTENSYKNTKLVFIYTFILLDVTNNKDDKNDSFFEKVMPPNSTDLKQLLCHA